MTASRTGFVVAGIMHAGFVALLFFFQLTGSPDRESFRLDFRLSGGGHGQADGAANAAETDDEATIPGDQASPTSPGQESGATSSGMSDQAAGAYAGQNLAAISGIIQGRIYYPRIARRQNWQGSVLIHFVVGTDGKAHDAYVKESSGHSVLDESALETVRALEGLPRPWKSVELTIPVHFRLH